MKWQGYGWNGRDGNGMVRKGVVTVGRGRGRDGTNGRDGNGILWKGMVVLGKGGVGTGIGWYEWECNFREGDGGDDWYVW